ncbi:hypothetical protein [Microcystis sp. BLCC-F210]|jgi:hypothetical protein|uniref:Uncharacterized protein n=1 Tax=Microcystis aeruginosa Ma_MB_F_20061100_S20D TaxID=2486253 RepID=A0A552EFM5_MICAE|nr:MAG: hypothetical protein EWV50_21155 [Microcystis aeruginosa Ma_MB_F_20061100_S20]TRU33282.1 MAG: hypothetical protein EWV78_15670 [Microcystis aeruginosa Ma_MB_F_20061100_S20D]
MSSEKDKEFLVGRGGKAKLSNLKDEPKSKHYDTASYRDLKNAGETNTVGNKEMIKDDIRRIKNGEATRSTTKVKGQETSRFTLDNGRTYRAGAKDTNGEVTLFPEKGPRLTQLNKKESRALGVLNDHGIEGNKAKDTMRNLKVSPEESNKAIKVWQKAKGKNVSSQEIDTWKRQYASEYKKKNSPTLTQSKSLSQRKR